MARELAFGSARVCGQGLADGGMVGFLGCTKWQANIGVDEVEEV